MYTLLTIGFFIYLYGLHLIWTDRYNISEENAANGFVLLYTAILTIIGVVFFLCYIFILVIKYLP